jgi:hypothetical protein
MFRIFLTICLVAGVFGGQAVAREFIDTDTHINWFVPLKDINDVLDIHYCRDAAFMVGVHVGKNEFLCDDSFGIALSDATVNFISPQLLYRYESQGMAACPPGKAMFGLHVAKNVLLCANCKRLIATRDLFIDAATVRLGMHACPEGSVMVGIHVGRNLLLCGHVQ